jgi:hypothetical protein
MSVFNNSQRFLQGCIAVLLNFKIEALKMGRFFAVCLMLFCTSFSFANTCSYSSPQVSRLPYEKGFFLAVYFSNYQFDLPALPTAFLSGDGFIAKYPRNEYVGVQHQDSYSMAETMSKLAPDLTRLSDFYRMIYTVPGSIAVTEAIPAELALQRRLLKLDCESHVVFYRVEDVDIIFHRANNETDFHKIFVLGEDGVDLITVRGSEATVMQIIRSIKRRF